MPVAERDGERIVLKTEFREREQVKQVPGVRWSADEQVWYLPLSWAACMQIRGVFGAGLKVGQHLDAWAREQLQERVTPCLALRAAEDSEDMAIFTELRPFQRAGAMFLRTARQALIADEMGLGKTVQTIAALESLGEDAYPALIVCPNSMKHTWQAEFARWAPSRLTVVAGSTAAKRRKAIEEIKNRESDVVIMNYEALRYETRLAPYGSVALTDKDREPKALNEIQFRSVVADEAHRIKDPSAKQTRALWWIGRDATNRYALTGTPVANSPEDIWTLMRFVSPEEFPAKTRFIERYAMTAYSVFGFNEVVGIKSEMRDELFKILDPRFIRRTKAAVLPQLPEKTYTARFVDLVPKQRKAYDSIRKEMMAELQGGTLLATNPLTKLTRLIQFASAYGEMQGDALILTEPSCKVDALEEIVAELGDQQAVVFAESKQLIELAAKRLVKLKYKTGQITGSVTAQDRANNVAAFQAGQLKILLCTLGAGGEGLTLTAANTAIFLQRSWSFTKNAQAEDRIHRIGQDADSVNIIDVVAEGTVEAAVHAAREIKADQLEEIARDAETLRIWLAK